MNGIPEVINSFNAYNAGNKLVGTTGEVTLPDFEAMTETISGAGILGEYDEAIIGMFGSMEQEVPFRTLDVDIFSLMNPLEPFNLTLRGAVQFTVPGTGATDLKGMRVVIRGKQKGFKPGKLQNGTQMDASVTAEVIYIMIEVDGVQKLELDKLNFDYKVNGVDLLQKVRSLC
jgi:P2 family phage contractile tail tube protein